jgi:hypothetical protein
MKIDELIERIKPKSRKELPFFLLKAAITILIARELFCDISHGRELGTSIGLLVGWTL